MDARNCRSCGNPLTHRGTFCSEICQDKFYSAHRKARFKEATKIREEQAKIPRVGPPSLSLIPKRYPMAIEQCSPDICPVCGEITTVIDSRQSVIHHYTRRRRKCPNNHRTTTHEVIVACDDLPYFDFQI